MHRSSWEEKICVHAVCNCKRAIVWSCYRLKMTSIQQNDPPRINFSGPLVMRMDTQASPQERRAKQNVAMQAIMRQGGQSDAVSSNPIYRKSRILSRYFLSRTLTSWLKK
jgi:hypothetical protein